jgi:hypothetical protein
MNEMTFREKGLWGSTLATLVVYGNYFATAGVFSGERSGMMRLVGTVVLIVLVEGADQIAIHIIDKPAPRDERDWQIEAKGYRSGYTVATVGLVILLIGYGVLHVLGGSQFGDMWLEPMAVVQMLLLLLVMAELANSVTQIYHYRQGA